jgi:L,D-peptidoglycan transpeptidase YkuD (ErfK/YbiS/YcfS/YnhG family)
MHKRKEKELRVCKPGTQRRVGNPNALLWTCAVFIGLAGSHVASASDLLQQVIRNNAAAFSDANQQIILVSSEKPGDVAADMYTFQKDGDEWKPAHPRMSASGGKLGFAPFDEKREGDKRAPTGIFSIERTFGYGKKAKTRMPYTQVTELDYWIDDANSPDYNKWVKLDAPQPKEIKHNEPLKRDDHLYRYAIVVEYNVERIPGKGSAIFIHWERSPGAYTSGCIATSKENMLSLFKWLDPDKKPLIIMGNEQELRSSKIH